MCHDLRGIGERCQAPQEWSGEPARPSAPRMSRGALRLRVAEPRSQSRLFSYDAGQIDTAAGFPGSYADTRRPGRQ